MSHTIFLPYPYALDTSQILHLSVEGAFIIGGVTLRKEGGGGNPITWRCGAQGLSKALPAWKLHLLWVQ